MSDSIKKFARHATNELFCVGKSNEAQRLVIEQLDGRDGGGYCREAVESHFVDAIQKFSTFNERQLRKTLVLMLKSMREGRPSDPRDGERWDRVVERAERLVGALA